MTKLVVFQTAIVATGTAQNLPNSPVLKSVTIAAKAGNAASITVGISPTVTAASGYILAAGSSVTVDLPDGNTNEMWAVGTSGDVFSVIGT